MSVYNDIGDPTRCFGLPSESAEMSAGEQLFDVQVLLSELSDNCPGPCQIGVNADSNPDVGNALNALAGSYDVDVVWTDISMSNPGVLPGFTPNTLNGFKTCQGICFTVGDKNISNCFTSVSCDPRSFMQPAVTRSLGTPKIPSRPAKFASQGSMQVVPALSMADSCSKLYALQILLGVSSDSGLLAFCGGQ
jgi:hypothetical protein